MSRLARTTTFTAVALGAAAVAALLALAGARWPEALFHAYLVGFLFTAGLPLGAAALLMLHHLTGGRWGWAIRRPLEAAVLTLPLLALLFAPLALGLEHLYPWTDPDLVERSRFLRHRDVYLNTPFVLGRSAAFLALWGAGGLALAWASARQTSHRARGDEEAAERTRPAGLAAGGLVLYVLTVSFAAVDWVMALEREWFSTIFGLYVIAGQVVSALALMTLLAVSGAVRPLRRAVGAPAQRACDPDALQDLASLLMAFVVLHGYLAFSQWLVTWSGNKAHEIVFYLPRLEGPWAWLAGAIGVCHFALPFGALLVRRVKRSPGALGAVAVLVLLAQAAEDAWFVLPSARLAGGLELALLGSLVPLTLGALWLLALAVALGLRPSLDRSPPPREVVPA